MDRGSRVPLGRLVLGFIAVVLSLFGTIIVLTVAIANRDLTGWLVFAGYVCGVWVVPTAIVVAASTPTRRWTRLAQISTALLVVHLVMMPGLLVVLAM